MTAGASLPAGDWAWVVVNSSGGKDSQTALRATVAACDAVQFPRGRIVVSHQELISVEWPGVLELVHEQAAHYGLRVEVSRYRTKDGEEISLVEQARRRKMWPSSTTRYCTSDSKRGPGNRVLVALSEEREGGILQVFGFRAQESPARGKKKVLAFNERASAGFRPVWDWLPIHAMTEEEVWADIRESGVRYHPAYDLGMPRLSCCFCIYASRDALMLAGIHNPKLLDDYCAVEEETGHSFKHKLSLRSIRDAIQNGEKPGKVTTWKM